LRKRYYVLLVARDGEGQIRKIPIPLHYIYVFLAGALIGMFTITGMAGSYTRMLMKVASFNQLRTEKEALKNRYSKLEKVAQEKEIQAASLGSLAGEVSTLYGLKTSRILKSDAADLTRDQFASSLDQLYALRSSALSGAATVGIELGGGRPATTADWMQMAAAPTLWPVEGHITGSFGERIDPFNGEGAFHTGVDISASYGQTVVAPADGLVIFADQDGGYGRLLILEHGNGISTRYGHLSSFAAIVGQSVRRGDVIGYVGQSGRATGPHLHYEVRLHDVPVNPHKYMRISVAQNVGFGMSGQ
jgi:murein DD-endopeptidase MepM/ murein hydrolase activator NlpD